MSIGVAYIASDVSRLDYTLQESIASVAPIADQISICVGPSIDNTLDIVKTLAKDLSGKIIYRVDNWLFNRGFQQIWRTKSFQQLETEWILLLDADEILHENQLQRIVDYSVGKADYINFRLNHYFGLPHWINGAWFKRHTRMWRDKTGVQCFNTPGSACTFRNAAGQGINGKGPRTDIVIHHYGHTRDAAVAGLKQTRFNGWYHNNPKTVNGNLPDFVPFEYGVPECGFLQPRFERVKDVNIHPEVIVPWLQKEKYLLWHGLENVRNVTNWEVDNPILDRAIAGG